MSESQEQTPARKLIGPFLPKLVSRTSDVLFGDIWINEHTTFDRSDLRSRNPRFTPEAIKANQAVLDLLSHIGEQKQATPAQIALAWLLAQKPWIVPIPGSRATPRLEESIGAVQIELTESDLREIGNSMSTITVLGDRY